MTPRCLIYGLVDPRTMMVRYVGLSSNGTVRPRVHRHASALKGDRTRKANWIRSLLAHGLDYQIVVLQESSIETLNVDEQWWILYGSASGWPLTNVKGGGGVDFGWSLSEGSKEKISAARRGRPLSPEHRAKISIGLKNSGRVPSERQRASVVARNKLGWTSEQRANHLAANTGRRLSTEQKAKISAASRARWADPEWKARVIAGRIGEVRSIEARARMSIANKARRDRERAQRGALQ